MKQPSDLSLEQLLKNRTTMKSALIGLSIMVLLLAGLYAYMYFIRSKSVTFIPLFTLPMTMLPIYLTLKSTTEEIKLREAKGVK